MTIEMLSLFAESEHDSDAAPLLSANEFGAYLIRFTAVPEPSSLALLVFLPLALRRKRETR